MLEDGVVVGFVAAVVMTLIMIELLILGAEGSAENRVTAVVLTTVVAIVGLVVELLAILKISEGKADIDAGVFDTASVFVEIGSGELVAAAVDVLWITDKSSPIPAVSPLALHCPKYAQYWPLLQHIDPHGSSPSALLQDTDEVAAAVEAAAEIELGGADILADEDGEAGGSGVEPD